MTDLLYALARISGLFRAASRGRLGEHVARRAVYKGLIGPAVRAFFRSVGL
jgi:hypothetical protein